MNLLLEIKKSIESNFERNAFYINSTYYSYKEFGHTISAIRKSISDAVVVGETIIGLVVNNDLQTYASIFALWMEGKAYVPLHPDFPKERNNMVLEQAGITTILDSSSECVFDSYKCVSTYKYDKNIAIDLSPNQVLSDDLGYIFFTSGTTGTPKGVPITFSNLESFMDSFWEMEYPITKEDRCLQMFELTFDLSVFSFLAPVLKGACIYTIPKEEIKYSYIFELMEDHELTFTLMVPSILHYLRPYFEEINCTKMKYSLFCGEALSLDITEEWSACIPNATIANVYGPTECTIFCTNYTYNKKGDNKTFNGVLTIGKDMKNTKTIIVDDLNQEVKDGESGELCLSGTQLTKGYWKNEVKNKEVFFDKEYQGKHIRFYRTGDLCSVDKDGDILYKGRVDFQTKIQGFRVELSEIEFHAKSFLEKTNIVAIAFINAIHNTEIGLVIEKEVADTKEIVAYLKTKLPQYMIPTQIRCIASFPLNTNGKTDRNKLKELFK